MGFLAPLFLAGLLAVGLPLWLHRFARDTRTKQPFASLMLLEQSQIQQSREHTLKYWLLLALRILLLLLIALTFAQPVLPWRTPPLEAQDRKLHVIVMDTSLSMQQGDHWQKAVEKAQALIGAMKPADQGLLVVGGLARARGRGAGEWRRHVGAALGARVAQTDVLAARLRHADDECAVVARQRSPQDGAACRHGPAAIRDAAAVRGPGAARRREADARRRGRARLRRIST